MLVVIKFTSVMVLSCPINTQSFSHKKTTSTSQFIKGKLRDLLKLLRYFNGMVTSTFSDGTGSCAGWSPSPGFPGCGGIYGAFTTNFVLFSNDLISEVLSLTSTSWILCL